jgi:hypothetical protein
MTLITILVPTNTPPKFNDAFTIQCKKICESLSKKATLRLLWVMFPSIPPYKKSDCLSSNDDVVFFDDFDSFHKLFDHIKPDVVLVNGSLDFHNVETILVSKFKKIPLVTLFFRNPYVKKLSIFSTFKSRFRSVMSEYDADEYEQPLKKSFTTKFFFNQFQSLFKTLHEIHFTKIQTFIFFLKYVIINFSDVNPTNKIISGDINLCNVDKNKDILLSSNFNESSIFVVGDPYFDNHDISEQKYVSEESLKQPKILFITPANHEHGLCSKNDEMNLIVRVINFVLEHNYKIAVKIHPSSSRMHEYADALKRTISVIPLFQSENLIELLNNFDMVITYGGSGAIHDSVLLGKPIVHLDFDKNITGQSIHHFDKIITHCKNFDELILNIQISQNKKITKNDIKSFFQKYLGYYQGKPSDNAANIIHTFFKKDSVQKK